MKVRTKIIFSMGVSVGLMATAAVLALWGMTVTEARLQKFIDVDVAARQTVDQLYSQGLQSEQALRNIILDFKNKTAHENLQKASVDFKKQLDVLWAVGASDPSNRVLVDEIKPLHEKLAVLHAQVKGVAESDTPAAIALLNTQETPAWRKLRVVLLDASKAKSNEIAKARGENARENAAQLMWSFSFLLLALIVAVISVFWLLRALIRPLQRAVSVTQLIAAGDLAQVVDATAKDEMGELMLALQRMQQSLLSTVSAVRSNAEGVASASAQIASGNNDLSARTEQQASALEETAASMEQLGSTVRHNADNARQANQLAVNASTVAQQGGDVVAEVVETMKGINASSHKIADIISVIDGIAFQTNILALNAAVEAARAGEQGRGFAVVASEVRSLASRSAEAAKEIKGLITASVERVELGTTLVDKAGATMTEVVAAIRRVTDIVGEISAASSEQSQGVAQVGEAVTQMDQATQQNAALVEQMAAAAASLSAQAGDLVRAVAVFKGEQGAQRAVAAPARAARGAALAGAAPAAAAAPARPALAGHGAGRTSVRLAPPVAATRPAARAAAPRSSTAAAPRAVAASDADSGEWESF